MDRRELFPRRCGFLVLVLAATPAAQDAPAAAADEAERGPLQALQGGRTWILAHYRYEFVDDGVRPDDAHASTLRTVLGYETGAWQGLRGLLELENVTAVGNDLYDSTRNGRTSRAVVADPESTEVNQAFVRYDGPRATEPWIGRRTIELDNQRWIGSVPWRQNHQTFDALGLDWTPGEDTRVFWAWVWNVNRVFGDGSPVGDARMDSHLVNASRRLPGIGKAVGYWYLVDVDAPDALLGFSTSTVGARLDGERRAGGLDWLYTAELAHQSDAGDNPSDVDAPYWLAELGVRRDATTLRLGWEVLGGSGDPGDKLTTPLATLFAQNGWADQFLVTPDDGLQDVYAELTGGLEGFDWTLAVHDFHADAGGDHFGSEVDARIERRLTTSLRAGVQVAHYDADDLGSDTTKAWLWLSLSL